MGKLSIVGKAEREFSYNAVEITVNFIVREKTTAEAVNKMMEQNEKLLEAITEAGVNMKDIHISDNSIDQDYDDDEMYVEVTRGMKIRLQFDMHFINSLMSMISEQDLSVDLDCKYQLTNREEIHMELMKEALADSKKKAEVIASVTGQKIVGIDSIDKDRHICMDWMYCEQERPLRLTLYPESRLSNKLQSPITTESESISVVWLIE
ncbi:MAG: SIMPL domain-containing protein [Acutalibacteraceae bacterium]|nr:SIMPL domain-containing protein [Acutalibacteraceae bacterium]